MDNAFALEGKIALVTGTAHPRGIGHAIQSVLRDSGATVIGTDLASQLEQHSAAGLPCDVTRPEDCCSITDRVVKDYGHLDILINNAGVGIGSVKFLDNSSADWRTSLDVNLMGVVNMVTATLPLMAERGGSIVNVASLAGLGAIDGIPACYTASKFAVIGLTKSLANEFAAQKIRVNAVCPGSVKTQMHDMAMTLIAEGEDMSRDEAEAYENSLIPLGHPAQPDEIANAVKFLASPASSYLTGTAIPVAGGMAAGL